MASSCTRRVLEDTFSSLQHIAEDRVAEKDMCNVFGDA
jgi:hypothetical protein